MRNTLEIACWFVLALAVHACGPGDPAAVAPRCVTPDGVACGGDAGRALVCPPGLAACRGACVDLANSVLNCGACGRACELGQACSGGACALDCGARTACPPDGGSSVAYCADLGYDTRACGACGRACAAGRACVAGACVTVCGAGETRCQVPDADGGAGARDEPPTACVALGSDANNCGACGRACGPTQSCSDGACACEAPMAACGGACVDVERNHANCGACGRACADDEACVGGGCAFCALGRVCPDGRCVDTSRDPLDCGACGHACGAGQACVAGACACVPGTVACGGACVDTALDAANCGACGRACAAGQACVAGACAAGIDAYAVVAPPDDVVALDVCALPGAVRALANIDDGASAPQPLPFEFRFYDRAFDAVIGSSNGYLSFAPTTAYPGELGTWALPSEAAPAPAVFVYPFDLVQRGGECFATIGAAPRRRFAWQVDDARFFADPMAHLSWVVYLTEGTNAIDVLYGALASTQTAVDGSNTITGIAADAGHGMEYESRRAGSIASGLRLRFEPADPR